MKKFSAALSSIHLPDLADWLTGGALFFTQLGVYHLGNDLSSVIGTKAKAHCPKVPAVDDRIPLKPVFAIPYVFSYVFWFFGPMAVRHTKRENFHNYLAGLLGSYVTGFLTLMLFPTYMDRKAEGLQEKTAGKGLLKRVLRMVYAADGGDRAYNLFPSFHCLTSLWCYLGVRKQKETPLLYRVYSAALAGLISLSTLFTKQHYFPDVIGGLGIPLIWYRLVQRLNPGKKLADRIPAKKAGRQ